MGSREAALEQFRQDARDQLAAEIEVRCRLGEDPWAFVPSLPSVDEQVVTSLREERIHTEEWSMLRARAYHPTATPDAAEQFEYAVLRAIALEHPELSTAVWMMLGDSSPVR